VAARQSKDQPIGERLRSRRVEVLGKGLREMARLLDITPPHLTDIETGRRTPSEELMLRISRTYGVPEAELRAGWSRPEAVVGEVATQDATTAAKVPEFLRTARRLSAGQWDALIRQAKRMASGKKAEK
jgi:transcriptional regulator with XRE-family HTH domain